MLIRVLGPVEVVNSDGRVTSIAGARPTLLLALLGEQAPAAVTMSRLIDALWADQPPVDPAGALQSQIARLRTRLGDPTVIETVPGGYRLAGASVDARLFEDALRAADGAASSAAIEQLDAALALWRGSPFGELGDHPHLRAAAVRLEEGLNRAREVRIGALLTLGRAEEGAAAAAGLAAELPLREGPALLLTRCLAASGRHAEALDALRAFRRALADEVGLCPSPAVDDLERRILRHEPVGSLQAFEARRPTAPLARVRPALPDYATPLVGRDAEVSALALLLAKHRLITVVGPGGVGKTRLAVEAARSLQADAFPDGRWFVDLTSVRSADAVVDTVAATLGVERHAGSEVTERLVEALSTRRSLLLLDNCEHVLSGVTELLDALISGTRELAVLATSRERLAMAAEHCCVLSPLPTPDGDRAVGAAAELFLDRARASNPGFLPATADEAAVCELCRQVDGLPLAIELMAMMLNACTAVEILEGLGARSALPERRGGDRRHRSMDTVIAWSYDLLDEQSRVFFEELSVFAGGFTREAAAAVTELPAGDAALRLTGLVNRSLVTATPLGPVTRYRFLEPVRTVAERLLATHDDTMTVRARHAAWMADMVRAAASGLDGHDEPRWSARLDLELGNLRAAVRHVVDVGDGDRCMHLLAPLYWHVWSGAHSQIARWAEECVGRFDLPAHPLFPDACAVAANGAWQRGDVDLAGVLARRGVEAAAGDSRRARRAHDACGDVSLLLGDNDDAMRCYRDAVSGARCAGDARQIVISSANLALAHAYAGDVDAAVSLADDALFQARRVGNPSGVAFATFVRGECVMDTSPVEAMSFLDAAIDAASAAGNRFIGGVAGMSAVSIAARVGDPIDALRRYGPLIDHWHRAGAWTQQWTTVRTLIEALVRAGDDEVAAVLLGALRATVRAAPLVGADGVRVEAVEEHLRNRLGDASFGRLVARGAVMGDAAAIELAREVAQAHG